MKHVLIIAYLFPPIGGGGVQRALKLAKYLGRHDFQVSVLTVKDPLHATPDDSLLKQIPENVMIYRAEEMKLIPRESAGTVPQGSVFKGAGPSVRQKLFRKLKPALLKGKEALLIPDDQILWYRQAVSMAVELVKEKQVDVILSTSGPYTNHLVGRGVKRKTDVKWIADFRDPWTQNMHRPTLSWRRKKEERQEASVMKEADLVTTVTPTFAKQFIGKYPAIKDKLHLIYNGYDPEDYENLTGIKREPERFTVLYTGIFYHERNPRLFLKAVRELIDAGHLAFEHLSLEFAGVFDYPGYTENQEQVNSLSLGGIVHVWGNLPHQEVLSRMKGADLLLLVGDTSEDAGAYIPGKLYEYMAVKKPILALTVEGESARIVNDHALGNVVAPHALNDMKAAILSAYEGWLSGRQNMPDNGETELFRRDKQAEQFAELIHQRLG